MIKDSKKVYFSKKLTKALQVIPNYRCSVVNAPFGYGKTTAVRAFLNSREIKYRWINATNSKDIFWNQFCDIVSEEASPEQGDRLREIGFPYDSRLQAKVYEIISRLSQEMEPITVVIDDYHKIRDQITDFLFIDSIVNNESNVSLVLINEGTVSKTITDYVFKNQAGIVTRDDLLLDAADIKDYFRSHSISVDLETAGYIFDTSRGWFIVLQNYVKHYHQYQNFNISSELTDFVNVSIWKELPGDVKKLFVRLAIFDRFPLSLVETLNYDLNLNIQEILDNFSFIDYSSADYKFYFHPVLKNYAMMQYNELPIDAKRETLRKGAEYYTGIGEYFYAICLYYTAGDYETIFNMSPDFYNLYLHANNSNKSYFLSLADEFWNIKNRQKCKFSLMLAFIMFLYNERDTMRQLCNQIEIDIMSGPSDETNKGRYLAQLEFVRSYLDFNDSVKMQAHYVKASEHSKLPITLIPNSYPCSFSIPSVLSIYYNEAGQLDELIEYMEKSINIYYTLTYGYAKGSVSLIKAEKYYLNGDFKNAESYFLRSIYRAESRNQRCLILSAYMYLCKIAIINGNYEAYILYKQKMENIHSDAKKEQKDKHLILEQDIIDGLLYSLLNVPDKFPSWLKDSFSVERSSNLVALSYVFNLHGQYLYLTEDYATFKSIMGQMIGLTNMFSFPYAKINTYILCAATSLALNEKEEATGYIKEAIMLSYKDNIAMPFVENYSAIKVLLDAFNTTNKDINKFIKDIRRIEKTVSSNINKCRKIVHNQNNHGLTPRETEIARLAAQRYSNKQIGDKLFIAESTVKSSMKIIFSKLGISSREDLSQFFS